MIWTFLKKRRLRQTFEKYITPESVDSVRQNGSQRRPLTEARIDFILLFVRGESPAEISERVGKVADLAVRHGAVVHDLVGALVIVAFGTLPASSVESGNRLSLVDALRGQFDRDIKIVHGVADGHCGNFGNENRMSYSFLVPRFDAILGALSRLDFGQIEEFWE